MSIQRTLETALADNRQPLSPILNSTRIPQFPSPFSTPRHQKNAQNNPEIPNPSQKWPRIGRKIPSETLEDVTKETLGYSPREWQTKVAWIFATIAAGMGMEYTLKLYEKMSSVRDLSVNRNV